MSGLWFSIVSASALLVLFVYLYAVERERYLAIWAGAWAMWVVRYAYGLISGADTLVSADVMLPLLVIGRAFFITWGAYELTRRRLPRGWAMVFGGALLWIVAEAALGTHFEVLGAIGVQYYAVFVTSLVGAGVQFLCTESAGGGERWVAGLSLILFGVLQATFPWAGGMPDWYRQTSYLFAHALQITIGMGVLVTYMRRSRNEALRLHEELSDALTTALQGHIPVCAHCRSIRRDEGDWESLESYVAANTTAELSHGVCPSCFETHYPGLGSYGDTMADRLTSTSKGRQHDAKGSQPTETPRMEPVNATG